MRERRFGNGSSPVARQIVLAEQRLDRRKANAIALGRSAGVRLRSDFASPRGLLVAGGIGFLAAEWLHQRGKVTEPARDTPSKSSSGHSQSNFMSKTLVLLTFALDLKNILANANSEARISRNVDNG